MFKDKEKVIRAVIMMIFVFFIALYVVICLTILLSSKNKETKEEPQTQTQTQEQEAQQEQVQVPPVAPQPQTTPTLINDGYEQTITKSAGVYYFAGRKETYYSSRVLRHKDIRSWVCDSNGFWRTQDGYFVISSNDYSRGTIIEMSMGKAQVLDCGCASGTIDIYVNW